MKFLKYCLPLIALFSALGCSDPYFISDKEQREEVESQLQIRKKMFNQESAAQFSIPDNPEITTEERGAMEFLYAYMPLNDIADYDGVFFLNMVRSSFKARDFFKWGRVVPEELFRHFVLPPRVNNEDLDSARIVFFNKLKERIKDLSMYDAALEVNHWCHEKVTYRPSDSRTSSPLATVLSGYGRCGEESTFTVTALRAVGIPARQCYTPRWAHTDDNHAWVEVWCDGKWYFMGACEPESELNMAWFAAPAKRAMMVHTNVFGRYHGPESKTDYPLYTKINVLGNYTQTKQLDVTVYDLSRNRVEGADVKYLLYNYAEFYPIYEKQTDKDGRSYVISGLGDLIVWAKKDEAYGYQKVSLSSSDSVDIVLDRASGGPYEEDMDIVPPAEQPLDTTVLKQSVDNNASRLKTEDSIRNSYLSTFMGRAEARQMAEKMNLDTALVIGYILKSEGNWREISSFIEKNKGDERTLQILSTISDKDLRDTPSEILQSHLDNSPRYDISLGYSKEVYIKGILAPRVLSEKIRKWRPVLSGKFHPLFGENPDGESVKRWIIENISIDNDQNYPRCPISPEGVGRMYMADKVSRDIFYVAVCRSIGIPTVIDPATSAIKQFKDGYWSIVSLDPGSTKSGTGKLIISTKVLGDQIPQYWSNYTIARMVDGIFVSLDFENDSRVSSFPATLELEEGYYRICTGNRYDNGKVLVHCDYFNVPDGSIVRKELRLRELEVNRVVYGTLEGVVESDFYKDGGVVVCFIDPDKEPTKHLMNEFPLFKREFNKWKGEFLFAVPESKFSTTYNSSTYKNFPTNSKFITEDTDKLLKKILASAGVTFRDNFPLIFIINEKGEIIFHSQGYKIGTVEFLHKSLMAEYSYICSQPIQ